jgi:hypothetical protein
MDLRWCLVSFLFFFFLCGGRAAGDYKVIGGRAAALGYTSVAQYDAWSAFNNQAGLAWCRNFSAGAYFENRYLLKEFSLKALAVTLPVGKGAFGVTIRQFGFSLYSELNTGVGYGLRLSKNFSAGIQVDFMHLHVGDNFQDKNLFTFEIGLQYHSGEHLWLGFHAANPWPVKLSSLTNERLPTLMRLGLSWRMTEGLYSNLEVEKDLLHRPALKASIEYRPVKVLTMRIGFLSNPTTFTFGFGLAFGNVEFDIASSYHLVLGYSPQASVSYIFGKAKKKGNK